MAYFEIDFTPDGVNNASLVDSDNWSIPNDAHLDILLWNKSDAPADVFLRALNNQMFFSIGQTEYVVEHERINQRNVVFNNNDPLGNTFEITHLAPRSVYPLRITNLTGSAATWLDADSCTMEVRGHATNLYNQQRIYVVGHSPSPA